MTDPSSLRKAAKARGLKAKLQGGLFSLFDGDVCVWLPAPHAETMAFLKSSKPARRRGRPRGWRPPQNATITLGPKAYVMAKRFDYRLKVEDGVIRLRIGDEVIFESREPQRLRLFFEAAHRGAVKVGPAAVEAEKARREAVAAKAAAAEERGRIAAERRKAREAKSRAAKMPSALKPDDPGEASPDFTPGNYRGLVETSVWLPDGISGDACLIGLWAAENHNPWAPAKSVLAEIAAAELALAGRVTRVEITLSDHDRASIARYGAPVNVALAAAAMARPQTRSR